MRTTILIIGTVFAFILAACSESDNEVKFTTVTVQAQMPEEYASLAGDGLKVTLTNTSTNRGVSGTTDTDGKWSTLVEEGVYHIKIAGEKISTTDTVGAVSLLFQASKQSHSVAGLEQTVVLEMEYSETGSPWLIKEIYFAGSKTPADKNYQKDQFIEIFNNSDDTLYADGLAIGETYITTSVTSAVRWDQFLPDRIAIQAYYSIPGNGKDYPVAPGKSVVIANKALNHKGDESLNPNSPVDLSNADFEWVDANAPDIDVPEVPNLVKHFCYTATIWVLNQQGTKSYIIFRPDKEVETFMNENFVQVPNAAGAKLLDGYAIPRTLIFDGVELSKKDGLKVKALPSSIDAGYSYTDASGNGKSIRRKVERWENGRAYLQDTNNSSDDFLTGQTPAPFVISQ